MNNTNSITDIFNIVIKENLFSKTSNHFVADEIKISSAGGDFSVFICLEFLNNSLFFSFQNYSDLSFSVPKYISMRDLNIEIQNKFANISEINEKSSLNIENFIFKVSKLITFFQIKN